MRVEWNANNEEHQHTQSVIDAEKCHKHQTMVSACDKRTFMS
jgi:hypothetical protein